MSIMPSSLPGKFSAAKLSFFRDLKGESLKQVSDDIGYSVTTISKWEKGRAVPGFEGILNLSKHFGVNHNFFLSKSIVPDFPERFQTNRYS